MTTKKFKKVIFDYYNQTKRDFPWRETTDPYKIIVSEVMLQQTQALRVVSKYKVFIKKFPTIQQLAKAKVSDVLKIWLGLGYNRRALALKRLAETVVRDHKGKVPDSPTALMSLPGIGPYTAGAVSAFAFNKPYPIIETNIRTVYIHFFFPNQTKVDDKELLPLVSKTLDLDNPREWYWALMDYGAMLKEKGFDKGRHSKGYTKQSKFKGSDREVRGKILKLLGKNKKLSKIELERLVADEKGRVKDKLKELQNEGFILKQKAYFELV